jgi:hypothetical protein
LCRAGALFRRARARSRTPGHNSSVLAPLPRRCTCLTSVPAMYAGLGATCPSGWLFCAETALQRLRRCCYCPTRAWCVPDALRRPVWRRKEIGFAHALHLRHCRSTTAVPPESQTRRLDNLCTLLPCACVFSAPGGAGQACAAAQNDAASPIANGDANCSPRAPRAILWV